MATGEIAYFKQFLLLPQSFQNAFAAKAQKASVCGKELRGIYIKTP